MISPDLDAPAPGRGTAPHGPAAGPATLGNREPLGLPDLFDDGFIGNPYPWLDALRVQAPVHHDPGTGLWLVSRHRDIRRVLLDPDRFLPDNAQHAVTPLPVAVLRILARAGFTLPPALANNGTASHPGLRRVVTRFFNAHRVASAVPVIERIADELLSVARARIDTTGGCDLFTSFAQALPCRVLMELLGIRHVDAATLMRWSDASLELFWGRPTPQRQLELAERVGEFHQWLTQAVRGGTAAPGSFIAALTRHRQIPLLQLLGTGRPPVANESSTVGISDEEAHTRATSSMTITVANASAPAPPYSSGTCTACRSAATSALRASAGKRLCSSTSAANGAIFVSASERIDARSISCSSDVR
ncbi:hypothetical protein SANTM175S_03684 [Streptomyces antimycoticus]